MNAQGQNVKIYSTDDQGNKIETPKYDALNTTSNLTTK